MRWQRSSRLAGDRELRRRSARSSSKRDVKARVDVRGVVLCVCDSSRVFAVSSVREPTEPQRFQAQVVRAPGALLGCWVSRPAGPGGAWRSTSPTTLARFVIEPCLLAL